MKKVIQDIVMGILVVFMCLIFGRTSASGSNNLAWLVIVIFVNSVVIISDLRDYVSTLLKQLVVTVPFIITLIAQNCKIGSMIITETCRVLWQNYAIGFAICAFNIAIYLMNRHEEDGNEYVDCRIFAGILAALSGLAIIVMVCVLVSKI